MTVEAILKKALSRMRSLSSGSRYFLIDF